MTENEAIEKIIAYSKCLARQVKGIYEDCNNKRCDDCDLCYMQGTTGEHMKAIDIAIQTLEEVQQYRAIGTPEECRAAMEQKAKKVIEKYKAKAPEDIEAYGEDAVFGYCPVCGNLQNNVWNTKYCGDCGQKLDWRDEE